MTRSIGAILFGLALLLYAELTMAGMDYPSGLSEESAIAVDNAAGEVRLLAVLQPKAFGKGWFTQLPGHHAVTWKGGKKGGEALLSTFASDSAVYDALIGLGAVPGDNLSQAVWEERKNPRSKAPDSIVEGTPMDVLVWWQGLNTPIPLSSLMLDPGGKGVDLRFGGHMALVPLWRSGCIVCMQSCPGGRISNRAYSIRDYVEGRATFTVNDSVVPEGDRRAVVIIRVKDPVSSR